MVNINKENFEDLRASDLILDMTCLSCPEAYDIFIDDIYLGYIRIWYGNFATRCFNDLQDCQETDITIYSINIDENDYKVEQAQIRDGIEESRRLIIDHYRHLLGLEPVYSKNKNKKGSNNYCIECGCMLREGAKYCHQCGERVVIEELDFDSEYLQE